MYTKAEIFNMALNALLLQRQIVDADEDQSVEAKQLRKMWLPALKQTISDLDLDRHSNQFNLELYKEEPNNLWSYAYHRPINCASIRRIQSTVIQDNADTKIPLVTGVLDGRPVIYTNAYQAVLDYIPTDVPLSAFAASDGLALAHKLALLCRSLIVGKGAKELTQEILQQYIIHKAEAQEHDRMENMNFEEDRVVSGFAAARLS